MSLTTSCFRIAGRLPNAVSIANGQRGFEKVPKYRPLVPSWHLVQLADRETFEREYMTHLARLNPQRVVDELPEDAILLCWEKPGEFCHRRLVARWLEAELGFEVPEYVGSPDTPGPKGREGQLSLWYL